VDWNRRAGVRSCLLSGISSFDHLSCQSGKVSVRGRPTWEGNWIPLEERVQVGVLSAGWRVAALPRRQGESSTWPLCFLFPRRKWTEGAPRIPDPLWRDSAFRSRLAPNNMKQETSSDFYALTAEHPSSLDSPNGCLLVSSLDAVTGALKISGGKASRRSDISI